MAAIVRHLQQGVVAVQRVAVGDIGARGHQQAHRVQVAFAYREVQRRHVPVLGVCQGGVALQRVAQRRHVARASGRQHVPGRRGSAARQFPRLDETRFGHVGLSLIDHPASVHRRHARAD